MSKVVVTGGSGFIGKAVCTELKGRGHEPLVLDASVNEDVTTPCATKFVWENDAEAVIHLAGVLGTSELFDDPFEAIDVNIGGTVRMLKACAKNKIPYVGITMPQVWDNVYQTTKMAAMKMASAWHRHFEVPVSHVRAYNVFGEHQKIFGVQKIVPTFSHRAWLGLPIPIWGDGDQLVDLIYVQDVARMMVDALDFGDDIVFDAGTGSKHTVLDVATMVNALTANTAGVEHLPMRVGEHGKGVISDGENLWRLGWKPQFLMEDFKRTVEWYRPQS